MKVLNLMKTSIGGAWGMQQMKELVRLGVDVHAALPDRAGLFAEYRRAGIQTHLMQTDFPLQKPWLLPRRTAGVRQLVEDVQPDIVHSHFVGTTLTMRLALRCKQELPRIFQVPGPLHLEQFLFRKVEIATAQNNDYWIGTCSATRKRYLQSGIPSKQVFLSFYGAYLDEILRRKTLGKLRGELGLSRNIPLIGMVAYIYKPKKIMGKRRGIKGHEDLIDAVAIVAEQVADIKVVFVGGPWEGAAAYAKNVEKYAEDKIPGRAVFLGTRRDVPELYADFDVAVHPSHSENLGGARESLLMRIPTIATNVGGHPDIVKPGISGYLVRPAKPSELARTILHVLQNREEAKRLAETGCLQILGNNDVHLTARKVFNIYHTILSAH